MTRAALDHTGKFMPRYQRSSQPRIADAGFPEPIFLGGLRFWKLSDLERWDRDQKDAPKSRPARDMKAARVGR